MEYLGGPRGPSGPTPLRGGGRPSPLRCGAQPTHKPARKHASQPARPQPDSQRASQRTRPPASPTATELPNVAGGPPPSPAQNKPASQPARPPKSQQARNQSPSPQRGRASLFVGTGGVCVVLCCFVLCCVAVCCIVLCFALSCGVLLCCGHLFRSQGFFFLVPLTQRAGGCGAGGGWGRWVPGRRCACR